MTTKRYDSIALLSHGWDVFYSMAAIESQYGDAYSYSHMKFLERLIDDTYVLPAWIDDPSFYRERADEFQAKQKLYERAAWAPRSKKRVVLMGDDLEEARRRQNLVYTRKRRMNRLVNSLRAKGATDEAKELVRFVNAIIENPVGKVVDLV